MRRCDRWPQTKKTRRGRTRRVLSLGEQAEEEGWFRAARRSCARILSSVQFSFTKRDRRVADRPGEIGVDLLSDRRWLYNAFLEEHIGRCEQRGRLILRVAREIVDH